MTFTVTASDDVGVTSGPTCSPSSGSNFSVGTTTVTCTASDAAGNTGTGTFTVTVSLEDVDDTTPPTVTVSAYLNGTSPTGRTLSITGDNWEPPLGFAVVTLYKDGQPLSGSDELSHVTCAAHENITVPCLFVWQEEFEYNDGQHQNPIPESWSAGTYTAHWNNSGNSGGDYVGDVSFTVPALSAADITPPTISSLRFYCPPAWGQDGFAG